MRRLLAVVAMAALLLAGCAKDSDTQRPPTPSITVVADPAKDLCQPKDIPGNCWLPLFLAPRLGGGAVNQSEVCNNQSLDQSTCWPQPGTELKATCLAEGADKRPWYGIEVPRERVLDKHALEDRRVGPILAYISVQHLSLKDGGRVGDLIAC